MEKIQLLIILCLIYQYMSAIVIFKDFKTKKGFLLFLIPGAAVVVVFIILWETIGNIKNYFITEWNKKK